MKQPLIMLEGLFQSADGERLQLLRVNLGFAELIIVNSKTISVTATRHILVADGENKVHTLTGGEEGDLLLLQGNVKLEKGGNIAQKKDLEPDKIDSLVFTAGVWIPW